MKPLFIPIEKVLELHQRQIRNYGGESTVRDMKLLESALAMPMSGMGEEYFHRFPFEMAAAYLFHIIQNHPFVDGNKRTGAVTALVFLAINGIDFSMPEDIFEHFVRKVSTGKLQKQEIAKFLEAHSIPRS